MNELKFRFIPFLTILTYQYLIHVIIFVGLTNTIPWYFLVFLTVETVLCQCDCGVIMKLQILDMDIICKHTTEMHLQTSTLSMSIE